MATSTDSTKTGITAGGVSAWATETVTVNGGGTLTYDTDYSYMAVVGKLLYWQFSITQTAAGSGSTDITIDAPSGVTLLDSDNIGSISTADSANNNIYHSMNATAVNSSNVIKIRRTDTLTFLQGGNFIGNNGVVNFSFNVVCAIE
jgi:hypothetical protein